MGGSTTNWGGVRQTDPPMARFQSQTPIHGDGGGFPPTDMFNGGQTGGVPEVLHFLS